MENMVFSNKIISVKILTDYKINNKLFCIKIYKHLRILSKNKFKWRNWRGRLFFKIYKIYNFLLFSSSFEIFIFILILHYIYIYFTNRRIDSTFLCHLYPEQVIVITKWLYSFLDMPLSQTIDDPNRRVVYWVRFQL